MHNGTKSMEDRLTVRKLAPNVSDMEPGAKLGAAGREVAARVRQVRELRRLSVRELSERLERVGRPILPSGVTKIEQGARRVDVDDLVALANALEVLPERFVAGSFGDLDFDRVDLKVVQSHKTELAPLGDAARKALAQGLTLDQLVAYLKLLVLMDAMVGGNDA